MLIVGISGHGKSALSNFILQEEVFQSGLGFIPVSKKAEERTKIIQEVNFTIIDTVGFSDGPGLQEHHLNQISDALEVFSNGINAIVFVIKSTERFAINIFTILTDLQEMSDIWDHCFVVFTNIRGIASTELEQVDAIRQMLAHPRCPGSLTSLMRMVNNRYMVVESVFPMGDNYYMLKISEMIKMIKRLKPEPYTNRMFQVAFSKYKEAKVKAEISEARLLEQQHSLELRLKQLEEETKKQEIERYEREKQEKERKEREKQTEEREIQERHDREIQERIKQARERHEKQKRQREIQERQREIQERKKQQQEIERYKREEQEREEQVRERQMQNFNREMQETMKQERERQEREKQYHLRQRWQFGRF